MIVNGVIGAANGRGGLIPAGQNPQKIVAAYINTVTGVIDESTTYYDP